MKAVARFYWLPLIGAADLLKSAGKPKLISFYPIQDDDSWEGLCGHLNIPTDDQNPVTYKPSLIALREVLTRTDYINIEAAFVFEGMTIEEGEWLYTNKLFRPRDLDENECLRGNIIRFKINESTDSREQFVQIINFIVAYIDSLSN